MAAKKQPFCCGKVRADGAYCSDCGGKLAPATSELKRKLHELEQKHQRLLNGVVRYIENHHKKMAGSTVQFNIRDLIELLPEELQE
jgi:hypothetical protein